MSIHIYIERERERETSVHLYICIFYTCMCRCIYLITDGLIRLNVLGCMCTYSSIVRSVR